MSESGHNSTLGQFRQTWPRTAWADVTTLVGVSGGADSVALLRLISAVLAESSTPPPPQGQLIVAHFDHAWRDDSAQDALFVSNLAQSLSLPCVVGSARDEASKSRPARSEERARSIRYDFFRRTAKQSGARLIALAHTADDQVETILHHAIRGTGLRGLAGMPGARMMDESLSVVRPLLGFRRAQLVDYLHSIGQTFCVDPSNADRKFTRSRIRHELLPRLREYNHEVDESLLRLGGLAAEASDEITRIADDLLNKALVSSNETSAVVATSALVHASPYVVREMFTQLWRRLAWPRQQMSYEKWQSLAELTKAEPDSSTLIQLPGQVVARRIGQQVELRRSG